MNGEMRSAPIQPCAFETDQHQSYQGDEEHDYANIFASTSTVAQPGAFNEDHASDRDSQMEDTNSQSAEVFQVSNSKKRSFEELNEDTELTEDEADDSMNPAKRIKIDESVPMETESVSRPQIDEMTDNPRSENVLASDSKDEEQIIDDQPPIDVIEASIENEQCQISEITKECEPSIPVIEDVNMDVDSEDIKSDDTAPAKTKKKTVTKTKKSTISKAKKSSVKKATKKKKSTKSKKAKTPTKKATRSKKKSIAKRSTKKKATKRKVTKKKATKKKTVSKKKRTVPKKKKTTKKVKRTVSRKKKPASKKRKTVSCRGRKRSQRRRR